MMRWATLGYWATATAIGLICVAQNVCANDFAGSVLCAAMTLASGVVTACSVGKIVERGA